MRKDSILQQYYYKQLPKAKVGVVTGGCPTGQYYNEQLKMCLPIHDFMSEAQKQQAQVKQSNKPIPVDKNYGKKTDPYLDIIGKETSAKKSERNKDLAKRASISGAAAAAIVTGGMAAPYLLPAMETPLFGTIGAEYGTGALTLNNLFNTSLAYEGAKNLPNLGGKIRKAYNDPTLGNIGSALEETGITALNMFPFFGTAVKGIPSVLQDEEQIKNFLKKSTSGKASNISNLNFRVQPQTHDLEELRRIYHNSKRFLQPEEAKFLHKHGHGLRENYRTDMSNFGWGTDMWSANNQLPPPPSSITLDLSRTSRRMAATPPSELPPPPPDIWAAAEGPSMTNARPVTTGNTLFGMNPEEVAAAWRDYPLDENLWSQNSLNSFLKNSTPPKQIPKNKSGFTMDELLQKVAAKEKDLVSKMDETAFKETVLKPTGEVVSYKPALSLNDKMSYNTATRQMQASGSQPLSPEEYAHEFNSRLDLLNDIIRKKNTSGVEYRVVGLDPSGILKFAGPTGESTWGVGINPAKWRGEVEDIANTDYFRSIPGLDMQNTTSSVFGDYTARRGTGAYESLNEYLKMLDLGRVKAGFNSQTSSSRPLWENAVNKGRAYGFYSNPRTVHGIMKTLLPGIGTAGALQMFNQDTFRGVPQQKKGGIIKDDRGQWAYPGRNTRISSPNITMQGVPYPVLGKANNGMTMMMLPGENYYFPGADYVDEYPMNFYKRK